MSLMGSPQWAYASGDFTIDQSLRFNDGDSAYLSKTFASAGNRRTWTFSCWVKPGQISGHRIIFACGTAGSASTFSAFRFNSNGTVGFFDSDGSGADIATTQLFRDPAAWYHIILASDTTQGTASNRMKIYVNGSQVTDMSATTYPSQNLDLQINSAIGHQVGARQSTSSVIEYQDGYLSEVHFIDGTALTPASFGETGTYGEWKPIEYDVTDGAYGTNGFYLTFAGGGVMSATGGTITTDGDYKVNSFTSNGTFTPSADGYVEYLVIAGGGSGGGGAGYAGGGGGAGGYRTGYLTVTGSTAYSITVGAGGVADSGTGTGTDGGDSVFSTITSDGGGAGSHGQGNDGNDGGSGGGGGANPGSGSVNGGSATSGQGNDGGDGSPSTSVPGGGGGGAGTAGSDANYNAGNYQASTGGAGGNGLASSITGSSVTRAGGGGGAAAHNAGQNSAAAGGSGGGGEGGARLTGNSGAGGDGTANTGSGGGGGGPTNNIGGDGGSGIVIIRYKFQ